MKYRAYIVENGEESAAGDCCVGSLDECHAAAISRVGVSFGNSLRPRVYENALYYDYEGCNSSICIRPANEPDPYPYMDTE